MENIRQTIDLQYETGAAESRINGLSVATISATVARIRRSGASGRLEFRARNQWLDGGHTRSTVKDYFRVGAGPVSRAMPLVVEFDSPGLFGGADCSMDPLEHLLAALAASVTTTLVWHAAARGIHVDAIETLAQGRIDLRGCLGLDPKRRPGYDAIALTVRIEAEACAAELDRLVDMATRYSPLFDTINRGTAISVEGDTHNTLANDC